MSTHRTTHEQRGATDLVSLRATLAMRVEDLRIARKHEAEAAARTMSAANFGAWIRSADWLHDCAEREQEARAAVIRAVAA